MDTTQPITRRRFLKCIGAASAALAVPTRSQAAPRRRKSNIIVIFTDDQGFADLSCQGRLDDIKTPNIDQLAKDGVRMTSGYVTAPQCIPSRAGLLTGRYQQRFGVDHNGTIPMPLGETLLPERLKKAGYTTGMIGKWHLDPNRAQIPWIKEHLPEAFRRREGKPVAIPERMRKPYFPSKRGFDDVFYGNMNRYWATFDSSGSDLGPNGQWRNETGYRLDIQTDAAVTFIERHHNKPFFLYLAYFAPHVPLEATKKYLKRFPGEMPERRRYALAMISAIDDGVGRIREALQRYDINNDTVIFFISDNGAPLKINMKDLPISFKGGAWDGSRNDPWIGEKGMLSEGGIRVPFLVTWPSGLPRNTVYHHPVISLDVAATAVALAGLEPVPELDGVNLIPYLRREKQGPPHEVLYWRFWSQTAVRRGRWKYLQAGGRGQWLFDLDSSEHERRNRIDEHPEIAADLRRRLQVWARQLKDPVVPDGDLNQGEERWYSHYFGLEPAARKQVPKQRPADHRAG